MVIGLKCYMANGYKFNIFKVISLEYFLVNRLIKLKNKKPNFL
jgi:hypothetical protein